MAMQIALPFGRSTEKSNSTGMMYFFNRKTGESTWEHPAHQPGKSTRDAETQFNGVYKPEEIRTLVPTPPFLLNSRRSRSPTKSFLSLDSPHWVIAPQNYKRQR